VMLLKTASKPAAGECRRGGNGAVIFGWNLASREEIVEGRLGSTSKISVGMTQGRASVV